VKCAKTARGIQQYTVSDSGNRARLKLLRAAVSAAPTQPGCYVLLKSNAFSICLLDDNINESQRAGLKAEQRVNANDVLPLALRSGLLDRVRLNAPVYFFYGTIRLWMHESLEQNDDWLCRARTCSSWYRLSIVHNIHTSSVFLKQLHLIQSNLLLLSEFYILHGLLLLNNSFSFIDILSLYIIVCILYGSLYGCVCLPLLNKFSFSHAKIHSGSNSGQMRSFFFCGQTIYVRVHSCQTER